MAGFLQRGLLLYLCLAIAMSFAAPGVIFSGGSPAENTLLSWFDMSYNETSGEVTTGSQFNSGVVTNTTTTSFTQPTSPAGASGILGFLDPVFQVFSWIGLIFKVLFSPIILLTTPSVGMPTGIVLILAVPLVFMMIVGLIIWIRSGLA